MQSRICIIGLGHIGLPIACILANSCYHVLGVDKNEEVVSKVSKGILITKEPNLNELLISALQSGNFKLSQTPTTADIYIIAVPTLLTSGKQPDLTYLHDAVAAIVPYLKPDNMVLIKSTCPVGTTELIADSIIATCQGVSVGYCPERALPGNIVQEILYNHRIIGGVDEVSTAKALKFYKSFIKGEIVTTNSRIAEAVKLSENAYRDVNIAYANELSMIFGNMGLDTNVVVNLANMHPRVHILSPGVGVGGNCLAVNPWFLVSAANYYPTLVSKAREVNNKKTNWVIKRIKNMIKASSSTLVACLGITYKANVSGISNSAALIVTQAIQKEVEVLNVDPHIDGTTPLYEAITRAQIIVILIAHDEFRNIPKNYLDGKIVLDFTGILKWEL